MPSGIFVRLSAQIHNYCVLGNPMHGSCIKIYYKDVPMKLAAV